MTTKRTFFCNVCGDEVSDKPDLGYQKIGYGFRFANGGTLFDHSPYCYQAENHICRECLEAAADMQARKGKKDVCSE